MCWPGEEPRKTQSLWGVGGGEVVAWFVGELPPGLVDRGWQRDLDVAEAHGDEIVGHGHVAPGQADDVFDLLTEHEDKAHSTVSTARRRSARNSSMSTGRHVHGYSPVSRWKRL